MIHLLCCSANVQWDTQEDKNQEINNGVMAAGEDRNNPLKKVTSTDSPLLSAFQQTQHTAHKQHTIKGQINCIFVFL